MLETFAAKTTGWLRRTRRPMYLTTVHLQRRATAGRERSVVGMNKRSGFPWSWRWQSVTWHAEDGSVSTAIKDTYRKMPCAKSIIL